MNPDLNNLGLVERLAILSEECGEVQQEIGKILRFGVESYHPDTGLSNRVRLMTELGDLKAVIALMEQSDEMEAGYIHERAIMKLNKMKRYTFHNLAHIEDALVELDREFYGVSEDAS